ncbi:ribonuclease domain-containing protein [Paenibacillus sp. RRE4]|uniref:ribonuclease domain-containing protein n=1 Tax=Paenibacillus sp. RRE4 TaxID=2962587 RepID=UPI0028818812|nr:ribonuclease domain-containing protein [Paenibacillus sp. RRE4]MDT0122859.1 ribonuclease domain-containing protein [Paenibacillus sp. RRE4]
MLLRKWLYPLFILLSVLLVAGCSSQFITNTDANTSSHAGQPSKKTGFQEVADYIKEHHELPPNYITKKEARKLGWEPSEGNLGQVAPGKSIGGDVFRNREGLLPNKKGRIWYEADIHYTGGKRGSDRILYSNDGLIYHTTDHYKTFQQIK